MSESKINLWQRLTQIYDEIEAIRKTGRNREQGYDYIEQSVIVGIIRQMLAKYGVVLKTEVESWEVRTITSKSGMHGTHVVLVMKFALINADNPQEREEFGSWPSEAIDFGDKAFNKASTIGQKYFLIRQFLISDKDPDEESPDQGAIQKQNQRQNNQPTAPRKAPETRPKPEVESEEVEISELANKFASDYASARSKQDFKPIDRMVKVSVLSEEELKWLRGIRTGYFQKLPGQVEEEVLVS